MSYLHKKLIIILIFIYSIFKNYIYNESVNTPFICLLIKIKNNNDYPLNYHLFIFLLSFNIYFFNFYNFDGFQIFIINKHLI
jgi:hypothetical protein